MNTLTATGWLVKDAWTTTQPGTGRQLLLFDLMLENENNEPAPWRCEIEKPDLAHRIEAKLVAGAGVIVRAELRARPFVKHGVREGFTRFLIVDRVEFSRLPVAAEEPLPT